MSELKAEFWSSTEYGGFLPALTRALAARGIAASARFAVTQERYRSARGRLGRWRLRAATYAAYPLQLAAHFRRLRAGTVGVVSTNTFYAPAVAERMARRDVPVVHWVLDLYPDVLVVAGSLREHGVAARILRRTMARTFERAAANIFLGRHLRDHAEKEFGPIPRTHVIPVGADGAPFRTHAPETRGGPPAILYCGNLGRMHDVETVATAIAAPPTGKPAVRWIFRANGAGFRELQSRLGAAGAEAAVEWGGSLADADWADAMRAADVALVTMRRGAEGLVMPSKAYSALVAGQAILAVCPAQSDLADLVREHACGWQVEPGDVAGLHRAVDEIGRDSAGLLAKRRAAFVAGHALYDQSVLAEKWADLLRHVAG